MRLSIYIRRSSGRHGKKRLYSVKYAAHLLPLLIEVFKLHGDIRHQTLPKGTTHEESLARLIDVVADVFPGWQLPFTLL